MADDLVTAMHELTDMQRRAVEWSGGPLLVLAGPGAGKTRVLTCRIARLLNKAPKKPPRVLALTFTNKAAHEMRTRLAALAPEMEHRAEINTFHGFCAHVLRQHGAHLGLKPNFEIFSRYGDREAVLADALRHRPECFGNDDARLMPHIDALKGRMVGPEGATGYLTDQSGIAADLANRIALAYQLYEEELRHANAVDFSSLLLGTFKLLEHPAMGRLYRTIYQYWLIDEFQDTNAIQYALLRRMAGDDFRQLFAVADDDQTIYEWNGANVRRISELVSDFDCEVIQLPTNFRCPPRIVEAANRLVVYNVQRAESKSPAEPAQHSRSLDEQPIRCHVFETAQDEAVGIAAEIAGLNGAERDRTLVLARTRALLEPLRDALQAEGVNVTLLSRRDDFASPQMRWLVACLKQIDRPLDRRNLATLVDAFGGFVPRCAESTACGPSPLDVDALLSHSATEGVTYLSAWSRSAQAAGLASPAAEMVDLMARLAAGELKPAAAIDRVLDHFENDEPDEDLNDDLSAWRRLSSEIRRAVGPTSLDRFLQELELRSKEPVPAPGAVSLATIHGAKGLEFNTVYLIGLAEEVLPSWHSVGKGSGSAALEEERRGCFVAITRTRERLVLSRARYYKGWRKQPSRFLAEMGFADHDPDTGSRVEDPA